MVAEVAKGGHTPAPDWLGSSELYKVITANIPRDLAYAEVSGFKVSLGHRLR